MGRVMGKFPLLLNCISLAFQVQGARVHQDDEWPLPLTTFSWQPRQSIKTHCCFSLTNQILWNFGLTNQISLFPSSRPSSPILLFTFVSFFSLSENTNCRITLVAFVTLHLQLKWTGCYFVRRSNGRRYMAATKWQFVGAFDTKWQQWTNVFGITSSKKFFFLCYLFYQHSQF